MNNEKTIHIKNRIKEIPKMSRAIRVSGSMFSFMPKRLMKMAIIMLSNKSRTKSTLSQKTIREPLSKLSFIF
jgi:hypothetical protein